MARMRKNPTVHIAKGQQGVHRVVSELIGRGHSPYLPVMDTGTDILLGSGVRIQVKTTHRTSGHWRTAGRFSFTLNKSQRIVQRKYTPCSSRKFSEEVDFVILHAIEANRFWVVPAAVLDNRNTVTFADGERQWKSLDMVEAKRMRDDGMSYQAIADALGAEHHTVKRRLNGEFVEPKRNYANVLDYENRWDLISGMVSTLREANAVVAPAVDEAASTRSMKHEEH